MIIVDHVYEAVTNKATKLLNPYIVVIQQDEVLESYKLKHIKVIVSIELKCFHKLVLMYS